ncbi:tripartite motif-containing protein 16-like isoform X1 [Esox lucius]|uniref:Tripartite motif-containing protein 16-like n=1 Tax=Esox lucius TaxID=8010 RepID=A0AAY5L3Q4_ESOLU|nr:tripartite motif-containing protein 16-like isoform X1 [Esox lucius]
MAVAINCSICLDLLKDPVTIPCGHSYCLGCIKACLDKEDDKGIYSCPQCKQTFKSRPVLNRNTILAELVKKLKKTRLQAAPPGHCYAGPGDVECDSCTGRKLKAVKSCLVCLASFCETHLQPHNESPAFKKHKLVQASTQLQEKICSHHDKLLEVFCRTDQQCICLLCTITEHKGHETVSATTERTDKQKQLGEKHQKSQMRIQEREKEIQELRQAVDSLKHSAQAAVEDNERVFTELIRSIKRMHSEMNHLIRAQEKTQVSFAEGHLEQLELEVAKLRRIDVELNQLSRTEDHIHFLQSFQSLCDSLGSEALPSITVNHHVSFEHVNKSISELTDQLQDLCKKEMDKISGKVTTVQIERPIEPKTREDFQTYSCQLTLDPNTANQYLCLSEGNRKVTSSDKFQSYPEHPDRFTSYYQVLCREGLSGVCYWEVEWSGKEIVVAVSYKEISRKGDVYKSWFGYNDQSRFGFNNQSWRFSCSTSRCCFYYNNISTVIPVPCSSRVGVYLDHRAGTLSFYSVSDTMTLLHIVQTTFTQPLYPGFYVNGSVKILTPQ